MNSTEQAKLISEMWKANSIRNAEKELSYSLFNESMNIYTIPGTRIVYMGRNGYECDREQANVCLSIGGTYTVKYIDIDCSSSRVELEEVPGKYFNTVMFRNT